MNKYESLLHENISDYILNFVLNEKIHFKFLDPALSKTFIFYDKKDALKVLSYLFRTKRKYYYHLNGYYKNGKKINSYESKLFIEYDDYLFNCVKNIKYYYINFNSYIIFK